MKPVLGALTVVMLGGGLSGCGYFFGDDGYFRDRGSDYQASVVEPRMSVPPELNSTPLGDLLPVPGPIQAGAAGKFQTPRPQALSVSAEATAFSMQQNGGVRWLLAQRTPADAWPMVRQFWSDYQVPVTSESPSLGELESGWLAFDQQTDNPLVRRLLPVVGPNRRIDGQEQRFRLRIEPGVQSGTSEIFVTHMARSQGSSQSTWPRASDNPNLERAVLAELENYLSQARDGGDMASLVASRDLSAGQRSSLDQDGAGNPVLNLRTDFNRAWAAVGDALARADVLVTDINRSSGVYYVDLQQRASQQDERGFFSRLFGRNKPVEDDPSQRIQVRLTPISSQIQVTVEQSIDTATDTAVARDLLTRIRDNLN